MAVCLEPSAFNADGARFWLMGLSITIPDICVTADDSRLRRGKPFPDPFLLAAADLGVNSKSTVNFEDSPDQSRCGCWCDWHRKCARLINANKLTS